MCMGVWFCTGSLEGCPRLGSSNMRVVSVACMREVGDSIGSEESACTGVRFVGSLDG